VPRATIVDIPPIEQARMVAELRRARYGYLLALHLLLLCAAGRTPAEIAAVLFCARSSVYRVVKAYRGGRLELELEAAGSGTVPARWTVRSPTLKRSVLAILKAVPRTCGWWRTRWSLCHDRFGVAGPARTEGLGRDRAALAP
jgi:hypothetical protein